MNNSKGDLLIVDDTVDNLRLLIEILSGYGYTVRPAPSGALALEALRERLPDLILLDIMMPHMDGYDVCRQLKADERSRDIPVIFISALHELFDKITAFTTGGVDYITKPFEAKEVLARVRTHLTLRQLQRDLQVANETLEEKVRDRTAALAEANTQLQAEIERRKRQQEEKDRLFAVLSQQSEQLRNLTTLLIQSQQSERQGLATDLRHEIAQKIDWVQSSITLARQLLNVENIELVDQHLSSAAQILAPMGQYVARITSNLPRPTLQEQNVSENPLVKLTGREREVLQLLAQGKSNREIGEILNITVASVYTYNRRIKDKLDLYDIPSLTKFALEHHLAE
jgi:DNA-binding response OmpR family regulator/DNA-binding CsgD family transcriptional regulator